MFIVRWEGEPPPDKEEWVDILREVLTGSSGSYRIRFYPGPRGWCFDFEWHEDPAAAGTGLLANSPESARYSLYHALASRGKPLDPNWRA